jgi:flagellar biosynthetic protein FlhB
MAEKPAAEKTEQPTPRKLQKAKEKGQVAQSQELPAVVSVLVLVLLLYFTSEGIVEWFGRTIQNCLTCSTVMFTDTTSFSTFMAGTFQGAIYRFLPILTALFIGSAVSGIVVSGLNFSPKAINLKLESIDPVKGFGKLFSVKSVVKLLISVAKLVFVSIIVWAYLESRIDELGRLRWVSSSQMLGSISALILGMLIRVIAGLIIIAAIDVAFQKYKYNQDMKMTKQQVKQENKDTEGSPEMKANRRRVQQEMASKRMLQEVPQADVVLVNPTHYAVALKYDAKTMQAPKMLAKGKLHTAEKIREIAKENGIPIIRKPELTRTMYSTLEPGDFIPNELYIAVAEVMAMIYRTRHRM